jgi:hypothetical protein
VREGVPAGWHANCGDTFSACAGIFTVAVDRTEAWTGSTSVTVHSESPAPAFGGVMQTARAEEYRGKRLRYAAGLRTEGVRNWTGLWLRITRADGKILSFDNMQTSSRALSGDRAWSDHRIVLDVPEDAAALSFGVVLSGSGKVWIDAVRLDSVGLNVAVTAGPRAADDFTASVDARLLEGPRNLDFEE